jgi:hypothetical protein
MPHTLDVDVFLNPLFLFSSFPSGQAHATFPNYSPRMRLYQFVRMLPAFKVYQDRDRFSPRKIMKQYPEKFGQWRKNIRFTELGKKLVALEEWEA